MHALLSESLQNERLELRFTQKPPPAVLNFLHATRELPPNQQWRYDYRQRVWHAPNNEATRAFAEMLSEVLAKEMPVYQHPPSPLEREWHEQIAQGLTHLPYGAWIEKFMEAMSDPGHTDFEFTPLTVKPKPYRPKGRGSYRPPLCTGPDGKPR